MKPRRGAIFLAAALVLATGTARAEATLGLNTARTAAKPTAAKFMNRHGIDEWRVSGCHRKRARVVNCEVVGRHRSKKATHLCGLGIEVRLLLRGPGTHTVTSVASHSCKWEPVEDK